MQYRNLDLEAFDYRAAPEGETWRVRVADSPAGEQKLSAAETVTLGPEVRQQFRRLEKRSLGLQQMMALGLDLAQLLFPPAARSLLVRSRASLDDDEGLRVRLRLDTFALADIPWEFTYLTEEDAALEQSGHEGFMVLDRRLSLVRYEVMGQPPGELEPVGPRGVRLVALLANPQDARFAPLDLETERRNLEQALKDLAPVHPEFFPDATVESLEDALAREADVFHFSGHGQFEGSMGVTFGSLEGRGFLVLVNPEGGAQLFPADKLAQNLLGRGVRLAFLGACEASRRDQVNAWTGVAPALTRAGVPAVVGMQYTVRDANAIAFSRRFYRALAAGQPVDAAVTDGRLAVFNRAAEDERDWGVPVLYLRAEHGVLFPAGPAGMETGAPTPSLRETRAQVSSALPDEERAFLESTLAQHKRNLLRLQQQKSMYGAGEEPLRLLNQIDAEEAAIAELIARLGG